MFMNYSNKFSDEHKIDNKYTFYRFYCSREPPSLLSLLPGAHL